MRDINFYTYRQQFVSYSEIPNADKMTLEDMLQLTDNVGIKNIIQSSKVKDLNEDGVKLVEWCVDFLLFNKLHIEFPKKNPENCHYHKTKYIALWSFIYDFLKISKNSGFDYCLMVFLEKNNILEYGCAIRCAWFNDEPDNPYYGRVLHEERKNIIINWAENAEDEI
jgi:hypothetical protein